MSTPKGSDKSFYNLVVEDLYCHDTFGPQNVGPRVCKKPDGSIVLVSIASPGRMNSAEFKRELKSGKVVISDGNLEAASPGDVKKLLDNLPAGRARALLDGMFGDGGEKH